MRFPGSDVTVAAYLLKHPDILAQHEDDLEEYPFTNSFILWVFTVLRRAWILNKRTRFPSEFEAVYLVDKECGVHSIPELHKTWLIDATNQIYRTDVTDVTGERVVKFLYDRKVDWIQKVLEKGEPAELLTVEDFVHSLRTITESSLAGDITSWSPFSDQAIADQVQEDSTWNNAIPLGYSLTDNSLRGGIYAGELIFLIAPTGKGKTLFMVATATQIAKAGYRILYIALDNPKREMDLRIQESSTGISKAKCESLPEYDALVREGMKEWAEMDPTLHLFVRTRKDFAKRPTANDIRSMITKIEMSQKVREYDIARGVMPHRVGKVDAVIVDYFARMHPNHFSSRMAKHESLASVADDLQELSMVADIPVITPAQLNRGGYLKDNPTLEDIASSFDAMHPAGLIAAWCQSAEEEKVNRFRLAWLKIRRGVEPFTIHYGYNRDITRVWEIPGEGKGEIPSSTTERKGRTGATRESKFKAPGKETPALSPETHRKLAKKGIEPNPALV